MSGSATAGPRVGSHSGPPPRSWGSATRSGVRDPHIDAVGALDTIPRSEDTLEVLDDELLRRYLRTVVRLTGGGPRVAAVRAGRVRIRARSSIGTA